MYSEISLIITLLCISIRSTFATQIFIGTSQLDGLNDLCGDYQEFACVDDICDPSAGSASNGRCRNGDDPNETCQPNTDCSTPTKGHCLENTVSLKGLHSTPAKAKNQGTDKHFYCVTVSNYNDPVIIWQNNDCTGSSCFVPGNGAYLTWDFGAQANCLDIAPETPVKTVPCLSPGEHGKGPFGGGFPAGLSIPVGGNYGPPVSYDNSNTCTSIWNQVPDFQGDSKIPNPPEGDTSQAYTVDDDGLDTSDDVLDRRASTTPVQALRKGESRRTGPKTAADAYDKSLVPTGSYMLDRQDPTGL